MITEIFIKYYSGIFILLLFIIISVVIFVAQLRHKKNLHGARQTEEAEIDRLMYNRNTGVPTSSVVDSLKTENVEYCGIKDRKHGA